jgi:hypothetical protein
LLVFATPAPASHPLNFLANNNEASAVESDGNHATGKGDTESGAIADAVTEGMNHVPGTSRIELMPKSH